MARALESALPDLDVRVLPSKMVGRGLTYFQVFRIFLEEIQAEAVQVVAASIVLATIEWFKGQFSEEGGEKPRPKHVAIYGPDGMVIKSVVLNTADAEPEDRTEQDREFPPMFPPSSD